MPLSAASNYWFNRQRCHIVKFYLEFCHMFILSPIKCMKHKLHSISNARSVTHLVNLSISSSSSNLYFSYYGRNYGFDYVMNNAFKPYLFNILSCSLKQFINFFPFSFCHYFMYPNNNLHKKLAVSEILNNLSLSLFWGPYSYNMCTCWVAIWSNSLNFFFLFFFFLSLFYVPQQ